MTQNLDRLIDQISGNGKYQIRLLILTFFQNVPSAMNMIGSIFTAGVPKLRCFMKGIDDRTPSWNLTRSEIEKTFALDDDPSKTQDLCQWKNYGVNCSNLTSYDECLSLITGASGNYTTSTCEDGYVYDRSIYGETAVTEWNLVCSKETSITLSTSLFFVGVFIASAIGGLVSDRHGRVFTIRYGTLLGMILGFSAAFSSSIVIFSILRILQIMCYFQGTLAAIVYALEISRKSWRAFGGIFPNCVFGIGCMLLSLIAYFCSGWRQIQMYISVPLGITSAFTLFLPKSPRWLVSKKRFNEAEQVLRKMARGNGVRFNDELWANLIETQTKDDESKESAPPTPSTMSIIEGLLRRPYTRSLVINNVFVWLVTSLVYYGLVLNSGNLGWNVYVSNAVGGLVESLSCLTAIILNPRTGPRLMVWVNLLVASFACLSSTLIIQCGGNSPVSNILAAVLAMVGRFGSSAAYNTLFLQTMQLFPTCGRTTALGIASMAARIGSIISPWTVQAQKAVPWLSQAIFGVATIFAAFIVYRFPKTHNRALKTSFDEAEAEFAAHYENTTLTSCCQSSQKVDKSDTGNEEEMKKLADQA